YVAEGRHPLTVPMVHVRLEEGDYALVGLGRGIAVERKSRVDLFQTIETRCDRFEDELRRLNNGYRFAAVVVEGDWLRILGPPPDCCPVNGRVVFDHVIAWQQRWPRVHWWMLPSRRLAEICCFRMLVQFWKDRQQRH